MQEKYEQLLEDVALGTVRPLSAVTSQNVDIAQLVRERYNFLALSNEACPGSVFRSQIGGFENKYGVKVKAPLGEDKKISIEDEVKDLVSKLAVYKGGRYVVFTSLDKVKDLLYLVNEVFYDTKSVHIVRFASKTDKNNVSVRCLGTTSLAHQSQCPPVSAVVDVDTGIDQDFGIPMTTWETLP